VISTCSLPNAQFQSSGCGAQPVLRLPVDAREVCAQESACLFLICGELLQVEVGVVLEPPDQRLEFF
jgi:hypothetical protein